MDGCEICYEFDQEPFHEFSIFKKSLLLGIRTLGKQWQHVSIGMKAPTKEEQGSFSASLSEEPIISS